MKFLFFILFSSFYSYSQTPASNQRPTTGTARIASFQKHEQLISASPYQQLQWRNVGPDNISGRCTDVWGIPGNKSVMYAAFATGGLWKTIDSGNHWKPVFDKQSTQSLGTLAIASSNVSVLYAGTGEANIFRASLPGTGIYQSTDAGETWQWKGLENTGTIARIVIHPKNPDVVYVAAGGNEWSYNTERGVYKTTNGGKTWQKILYKDEKTGCIDLIMDPSNPEILYASLWNRIRKRWSDPVPEDGDYIYKSINGGESWSILNKGLPDTKYTGRIGLAIAQNKPEVLYAFVDNHETKRAPRVGELDPYGRTRELVVKGVEVYRSSNKGEKWEKMSENNDFMERFCGTYGWVMGQIRVDPTNSKIVYILGLGMARSTNGGKTWKTFRPEDKQSDYLHGDNHGLWIDPTDPAYIINGDDGGVAVTYNGGKKWRNFYRNIPTTQFYNVTYDMRTPYNVYGSVQDEGSFRGSIKNTFGKIDTTVTRWERSLGGEGTIIAVDPANPDLVYASSFYGRLLRYNYAIVDSLRTKNIAPKKADDEELHRGEWMAYTLISPHDHLTIYHGMQYVFKSTDSGATWKRISNDLTNNNRKKMGKTPYAINHQAITALDESPLEKGLLYAGTDDGRVWVTENDGGSWIEITTGLPVNSHVSRVVASKYNPSVVYLTLSDRREDNNSPYIFLSVNRGRTWTSISGNIPAAPVNVMREDPVNSLLLYCGTDLGIYFSRDKGIHWVPLNNNLPAAISVQDLFIHPRDLNLVIATYGRGIYVMDNVSELRRN
ncbi:MAG TPA: hypothetical protein VM012_15395 [Flavitalea sp.]|nr:hypothetical protein [Flavitalea sp.]